MRKYFDIDSPFMQKMNTFANIMIVNVLFVICSIPIVTVGPAFCAMYYVLFKIREDKEGYILSTFFREFRSNLKKGIISWIILLAAAVVLYFDLRTLRNYTGAISILFKGIVYMLVVIWVMIFMYIFPFISKFENTIKMYFRNSLFAALANLKGTVAMFVMTLAPILITIKSPKTLWFAVIFWLMLGFGTISWFNTFYLLRAFRPFLPEEVDDEL